MKKLRLFSVIIVLFVLLTGCGAKEKTINNEIAQMYKDDKLYISFVEKFPNVNPIVCKKGDITNDGLEDLIIIYKDGKNTRMRVALDGENIVFSDEILAPVENQSIEFKDIDGKDEMEFIITGSKRGNIGYAIYRIIDNQPVDLFGEGMNDCC